MGSEIVMTNLNHLNQLGHGIQISRLDHSLIFMSLTTIWFLLQVLTNSQCVETMGEADGSAIPTHYVADC